MARKVGREKWGEKSGVTVRPEKRGEKSGARKVGREKWVEKSGAKKWGEKVGREK